MLIAIVLGSPIGRLVIPRALRADPERTLVVSDRMARIDVNRTLRIAAENVGVGQIAVSRIDLNDDGLVQLADTSEYSAKRSHPF
jgi:hypothetical protein